MENNENKLEKYLLEEVVEKKEENKKLKEERDYYANAFNSFRVVLTELVKRAKFENIENSTEKQFSLESVNSEKDKELYETVENFAKSLGVIPNE